VKTERTNNAKKNEAKFSFHCGDFQKMAEMMKNFCPGEGSAIDCCSMIERMMEYGKRKKSEKPQETQKGPKGKRNT